MATGREVMEMLMQRGLSPVHAAAIAGHMQVESGFNPEAYNPQEGAFGGLQWRLDRRDNLNRFAGARGAAPGDLGTQLDFILHEMKGPEAKAGADFFNATDLPGVHAALKRYIRYGSNTDSSRLANAQALLGQPVGSPAAAAPLSLAGGATQQQGEQPKVDLSGLLQLLQRNATEGGIQDPGDIGGSIEMARPVGLTRVRRLLAQMKGDV